MTGPFGISPQLPIYAPAPQLHYPGEVVVLVGRRCQGACEFFASWLQRAGRATVLGTEGTVGAGGAIAYAELPGGGRLQYTYSAELLENGAPYVEGIGVQPDVDIPVDGEYVEALAAGGDPDLDFAARYLDGQVATVQYSGPGDATASPQRQSYTCDGGVTLSVTSLPALAMVVFDGNVRTLARQETASGVLYADQQWEWHAEGANGFLTEADTGARLATGCQTATLPPVTLPAPLATPGAGTSAAASGVLTGTVLYRAHIALPPQAVIVVQLQDVSRMDVPAGILAEQRQEANGRQVPIPFELRYDPLQIMPRNTYELRARITVDGVVRWTNTSGVRVLTGGYPATGVTVVVEMQ